MKPPRSAAPRINPTTSTPSSSGGRDSRHGRSSPFSENPNSPPADGEPVARGTDRARWTSISSSTARWRFGLAHSPCRTRAWPRACSYSFPLRTSPRGASCQEPEERSRGSWPRPDATPRSESDPRHFVESAGEGGRARDSTRSWSFGSVTRVPGGTDAVSHTLPPMTEPFPMTVSPPRIVAPA